MKTEDPREYFVKARLTEGEYQRFLKRVEESTQPDNQSEYIRSCIFSEDPIRATAIVRELKNLNYQIRKIGINVNQIAAGVNSGVVYRGDAELIVAKFKEIEAMIKEFPEQFGILSGNPDDKK